MKKKRRSPAAIKERGLPAIGITYEQVDELVPYAKNARTHSEEQVGQIAASIKEFGFTNPVLIDGEREIIAGHGRVLAARSLGLEQVPCITLIHLTPAQKRAYVLADNKLALNAGWDEELLRSELAGLKDDGVELTLLGFDPAELDSIFAAPAVETEHVEFEADTGEARTCAMCGQNLPAESE